MITLSPRQIRKMSPDTAVYFRGLQYFRRGAIKNLFFDDDEGSFEALVEGTEQYQIRVRFDGAHRITASCNCYAFAHYDGFCKHIIAVLLALSGDIPRNYLEATADNQIEQLLHRYTENSIRGEKTAEIRLALLIRFANAIYHGGTPQITVSFKAGVAGARQYVVRSVEKLISAIARQEPLYFGKQFTYNPTAHYFSPDSRKVIDYFTRIHEIEKENGYSSLLKGREVELSEELFRRLLLETRGFPFTLEADHRTFNQVLVTEAELPLQFSLQEETDGLRLNLEDADRIKPLTRQCDLILFEGQIYYLPATPQKQLRLLLQTWQQLQGRELQISKGQQQLFFSGLYPLMEKTTTLTVSPSLEKRLRRPSPEARVFLDFESGEVLAKLEFTYGGITVDPFAPQEHPEEQEPGDIILIRDAAAEQQVMRLFEEAEFTIKGRTMRLHRDEDIWHFINEIVPVLQQHAAVYYSDRFKQAGRKAANFTGRVGIDWNLDLLELDLELEGVDREELAEIWRSLRVKRRYHRLRDGSLLSLEGEGIEQFARLADALELQPAAFKEDKIRLPKFEALHLNRLLRDFEISSVEESMEITALIRRIRDPSGTDFPLPLGLKADLRDYQKTGFKWLKSLSAYGFGGILADDMGLGKTVQAIAYILSERQENGSDLPPALIVAPASLIYNWESEINRFAPTLKTVVVAGTKPERRKLLSEINRADVAITSYPLLRRDSADYAALHFSSCFLDEAQYIKNPKSQTARCVRRLRSGNRFALTGTPIENSLTELWSLFQFIMPGYLQTEKKFTEKYGARAAAEPESSRQATAELAAKVRPFILRRLKEEVLSELPPKLEHRLLSELTREQKMLYLTYLERLREQARSQIQNEGFNKSRIQILAGLTRLRQICCHPALFVDNYRGKSAKLLQLQELLHDAVGSGHRILLFSQFTGMLQLIKTMLEREGYRYLYLDGAVKTGDRLEMVESFNRGGAEIFLISLKAGGTGLNLTGADVVVQYDLWWNPAVEEQAAGRAHRIGQKKIVQVIRLLTKNTIEEKIFELQQKKKELIDRVIQPGETFLSTMSEADIREILEI